jgi:hypothetical protein
MPAEQCHGFIWWANTHAVRPLIISRNLRKLLGATSDIQRYILLQYWCAKHGELYCGDCIFK